MTGAAHKISFQNMRDMCNHKVKYSSNISDVLPSVHILTQVRLRYSPTVCRSTTSGMMQVVTPHPHYLPPTHSVLHSLADYQPCVTTLWN